MKSFKFLSKNKLTENDPEYYNCEGFEFIGLTPLLYSPNTFTPSRCMLFRQIETGEVVKGNLINETHPMWNYEEV